MPSDLIGRVDWDVIYPPLVERLFELLARCRALGSDYYAISGHRSYAEQQGLYAQGRITKSPSWQTFPPLGKPVTRARPGQSAHNFGLACDFSKDADLTRAGLQPDWDLEDYRLLADEARKIGLDPAFYWDTFREGPHVQWNLRDKEITLPMLKAIHDQKGLKAVWTYLDSRGPWG